MNEEKKTMYQRLLEAVESLPKEAVERATKEITRKGYDTTGYQYQFLVNVLNEVVGLGNWGFDYSILKDVEGKWTNGKGYCEVTVEVTVWLMDGEKKVTAKCVGGHKSEMYADAVKGAITNGFKKTVAFFGVGKKAYEGTIDDDFRPLPVAPKTGKTVVIENLGKCSSCHSPMVKSKSGSTYCGAKCWLEPPRPMAGVKEIVDELDEIPIIPSKK